MTDADLLALTDALALTPEEEALMTASVEDPFSPEEQAEIRNRMAELEKAASDPADVALFRLMRRTEKMSADLRKRLFAGGWRPLDRQT
jgi:hypothetical protein